MAFIPVMQTKISSDDGLIHGNCFGACVASILGIPLVGLPAFEDLTDGAWYLPFCSVLQANGCESHGTRYLKALTEWPANADELSLGPGVDGYYMVGGGSPRGFPRGHCVIYKHGRMVHDPHPDGGGLTFLREIYLVERIAEQGE